MSPAKTTQEEIHSFWSTFIFPTPNPVPTIFPPSLYASLLPVHPQLAKPRNATESYDAAAKTCREKVERIVRDCQRANEKYTDPDFDLKYAEEDCLFRLNYDGPRRRDSEELSNRLSCALGELQMSDMLEGGTVSVRISSLRNLIAQLSAPQLLPPPPPSDDEDEFAPSPCSVHRVDWIFTDPKFTVDGFSSSDIKQGARNEACGVYGFVFFRDGEWVPVVIDDYLFLKALDFGFGYKGEGTYDPSSKDRLKHRKQKQEGSTALYFGACQDENETWLPLMQKAYAKAHGDYHAIDGGCVGEGVEDLTGGVATRISMEDVLDKKNLWEALLDTSKEFVFELGLFSGPSDTNNGLARRHAYSIIGAREETGEDGKAIRLVKIRNPWGSRQSTTGVGEWSGPWSDGSKEWTPYWMTKLDYKFGDDGIFWMTFEDVLSSFSKLSRTRLFDKSWTVVQEWTSVNVAWVTGYLQKKFVVDLKQSGIVVFVLSQLDSRYFQGLTGQYSFILHFVLQEANCEAGDYICRAGPDPEFFNQGTRSISCEVELPAGRYEVLPKITATRNSDLDTVEEAIKKYADKKPRKLRQVGLSFDLAHAKAGVPQPTNESLGKGKSDEKRKSKSMPKREEDMVHEETNKLADTLAEKPEEKKTDKAEDCLKDEKSLTVPTEDMPLLPSSQKTGVAVQEGGKLESQTQGGEGDGSLSPKPGLESPEDAEKPLRPWNAVCVIGLRLYAKDSEVTITLKQPKDAEEASSIAFEGIPPADARVEESDKAKPGT